MYWEECLDEHIVESEKAPGHVRKLHHQSKNALHTAEKIAATKRTARSKALLAYDAVREILEALAHQEGYVVHNHECYRAFLQEIIGASDVANVFDELRRQRNQLEYDATSIAQDQANDFVERASTVHAKIQYFLD